VRHVVADEPDSPYAEEFVVYYAHLDFKPGIEVGSVVGRSDVVGYVGSSGCTGGVSQLHMAVLRTTNTARDYRALLDTTPNMYGVRGTNPDNSVARIDPWGWQGVQTPSVTIDPGGYAWYWKDIPGMGHLGTSSRTGGGALSMALFRNREAPPRACDHDIYEWPVEGGKSLVNPYAYCSP